MGLKKPTRFLKAFWKVEAVKIQIKLKPSNYGMSRKFIHLKFLKSLLQSLCNIVNVFSTFRVN
jgi:hypothetical protein